MFFNFNLDTKPANSSKISNKMCPNNRVFLEIKLLLNFWSNGYYFFVNNSDVRRKCVGLKMRFFFKNPICLMHRSKAVRIV